MSINLIPGVCAILLAGHQLVLAGANLVPGTGAIMIAGHQPALAGVLTPLPQIILNASRGRHKVPLDAPDGRAHRRQIAARVNDALSGHIDCTLAVTLNINSGSTQVIDQRVSVVTCAAFMPTTQDAALEQASGDMYAVTNVGTLTIYHSNNAVADRTFVVALIG